MNQHQLKRSWRRHLQQGDCEISLVRQYTQAQGAVGGIQCSGQFAGDDCCVGTELAIDQADAACACSGHGNRGVIKARRAQAEDVE